LGARTATHLLAAPCVRIDHCRTRARSTRPTDEGSVHVARAVRDGGAAARVGVGLLHGPAVDVVGRPALVAGDLVGAQRRVADVPGRRLPRQRPAQGLAGARRHLLVLVHAALPDDPVAGRRARQQHGGQLARGGRGRQAGDRRRGRQEREQGHAEPCHASLLLSGSWFL
uniref:Uncharacterized protein n=1 Tax=Triticum urartu TaxID=4572 RepID=A0A8R7PBG6_TRIUA